MRGVRRGIPETAAVTGGAVAVLRPTALPANGH